MNKKLTKAEIEDIQQLQQKHFKLSSDLGNAFLRKYEAQEAIRQCKELSKDLNRIEKEMMSSLKTKYPNSHINFETFEIIPKES